MNNKMNIPTHISFARELRKKQTPAEVKMWDELRNRRLPGFKFLRQHPITVNAYNGKTGFYIADFYCSKKKLVIEIDGLIHTCQVDYDIARNEIMEEMGLAILRITNDEVEKNVYEVLNEIKMKLR